MAADRYKVLIVGKSDEARQIATTLENTGELDLDMSAVSGVEEAAGLDDLHNVDVVLLNASKWEEGVRALGRLRTAAPGAAVIMICDCRDQVRFLEALHKGAQDCLTPADCGPRVFARAIIQAVERKQTERDLRIKDYAITSSMSPIAMANLDGKLTYVNPAFLKAWGYTDTKDVLGRPTAHFWRVRKHAAAVIRILLEKGHWFGELTAKRKDESFFHVQVSANVIKDDTGVPVGMMASFLDITEQKNTEQALRNSEAQYRNLAEHANDGICIIQDTLLRYANQQLAQVTGYTTDQIIGTTFDKYVPPEEQPKVEKSHQRFMAGDEDVQRYESALMHKDGHRTEVEFNISATTHQDRRAALVFVRDITDRKKAERERRALEAQVQHAEKLKSLGVLAGGIAHDFNNLLTGILGNASLLGSEPDLRSTQGEIVEDIQQAGRRAAELCRQMLAYSGKGRFTVEYLDLSEIVRETAHLIQASMSKKAVLQYDLSDDLPCIEADPSQIRQVVMNLITNASDALEDKIGTIGLRTDTVDCGKAYLRGCYIGADLPAGRYVALEVMDTGCGMDKETREQVFEPFFSTKFTGRGLGLAAVLGIVRGHRGALKLDSKPGRGATFTVLFPACEEPTAKRVTKETSKKDWRSVGNVLIVDDEPSVLNTARRMLEKMGFTVLTATDGKGALDVFQEHADSIRLVLLDMTMPGMDGKQTFESIRRIRNNVRVLLSSGYNRSEVRVQNFEPQRFSPGALAGFVQKPYQLQTLRQKVREVFEGEEQTDTS